MKAGKSSSDRIKIYTWGLPALSGGLMVLSLPPLPLGLIAWIGLLPLFRALEARSFRGAFTLGYRAGLIYHLGSLYWVILNTGATPILRVLSLIGMVLILSLGWGLSAWLIAKVRSIWGPWSWLCAPLIWTAVEVIFSIGESGFPWAILALSQSRFLDLIQMVELTGVHGVTFWVVTCNALGMIAWREMRTKPQKAAVLLILAFWILLPANWGRHRAGNLTSSAGKLNVSLVQGNIPANEKWKKGVDFSFIPYKKLSSSLAMENLQLIVWPETAIPTQLAKRWHHRRIMHGFVDSLNIPIMTGASDYELMESGDLHRFNGAFLFAPGITELQVYYKIHPVPFGERIPWQRFLPLLGSFRLGQAEFTPGSRLTIFSTGADSAKFSVLICFESIFPDVTRDFVLRGAEFLVNITNDGWFGHCSEPYQHLELSRFRAIESRRWVIRAANTGISAIIAPDGRFRNRLSLNKSGTLSNTIELRRELTIYTKHGAWFPACCGIITIIILFSVGIVTKRDARR